MTHRQQGQELPSNLCFSIRFVEFGTKFLEGSLAVDVGSVWTSFSSFGIFDDVGVFDSGDSALAELGWRKERREGREGKEMEGDREVE